MPISSFTGSIWPALLLDGVTFTGAHLCPFLITCFQLLWESTEPTCAVIQWGHKEAGQAGGGGPALSRDSWVTGVSLGLKSAQWLLCTCQSSCDTNILLGDASRGERGERSSTKEQSPTSRWLPPTGFWEEKNTSQWQHEGQSSWPF